MENITKDYIPFSDGSTFIYRNEQYTLIDRLKDKCPECDGLEWNYDTSFRFKYCVGCGAIFDRLEIRRRSVKP